MLTKLLVFFIDCYRLLISPLLPRSCRFHPSCSNYAREALQTYGFFRGLVLTGRRLLKCHPYHPGGFDPVTPIIKDQE